MSLYFGNYSTSQISKRKMPKREHGMSQANIGTKTAKGGFVDRRIIVQHAEQYEERKQRDKIKKIKDRMLEGIES
jgi:cytochrome c-type biogenesis protein CcmE